MIQPQIRVWRPHRYQSDSGRVPVDQWAPGYDQAGPGEPPSIAINLNDIGKSYTLESCREDCGLRNMAQREAAQHAVEQLERELTNAQDFLARLEAALERK